MDALPALTENACTENARTESTGEIIVSEQAAHEPAVALSHLDQLEAESIHIIREAVANPIIRYCSIRLARILPFCCIWR